MPMPKIEGFVAQCTGSELLRAAGGACDEASDPYTVVRPEPWRDGLCPIHKLLAEPQQPISCPFCGAMPRVFDGLVWCQAAGCPAQPSVLDDNTTVAIARWNRRGRW